MHRFPHAISGLALLASAFSACDRDPSKSDEGMIKTLTQEISTLRDEVAGHEMTKMADEELQKLQQLEYKVVDLPLGSSPEAATDALMRLGREKWDCFDVLPQGENLRIFCKRRPHTYLRYLQQG